MASHRATYTTITTSVPRTYTLVGYTVVADYQKDGARTLVLERPETSPSVPKGSKPVRKARTPQKGTEAQETPSGGEA